MRRRLSALLLASLGALAITGPASAEADRAGGAPAVAAPKKQDRDARPQAGPRIIGGYAPTSGMWPWMVAVQRSVDTTPGWDDYQRQWCGGVLIHPRIVATAAHCMENSGAGNWRVLLGRQDLLASGGEAIDVVELRMHPQYSQANRTYRNDLALLILARPANATPAPLLESTAALREGQAATVMGWGRTSLDGQGSRHLWAANVPLRSTEGCVRDYASYEWRVATDTTICAGFPNGGNNTCKGDSGGPLMMQDAGERWRLVGLVSWAESCALAGRPTVFTFVGAPHLRQWLTAAMAELASQPADATPPAEVPAPSTTAPAAPRLTAWIASGRLHRRFRAVLRYAVSEDARVTVQIVRRAGRRWVPATRVSVLSARSGPNQTVVRTRLLRGSHRLTLQATGATGHSSAVHVIPLRIR